ncbi:MAG: hypothetical protein H6Q59_1098 [Firmicutes bacterium]|nr:hypothetical protein [Bacillota bacterium]
MENVIKMNGLKEIKEWDDMIEASDRKSILDDRSEIAFMVEEIEAFIPGC